MNQKNEFEYINSNIITLSDFAKTSTLFGIFFTTI